MTVAARFASRPPTGITGSPNMERNHARDARNIALLEEQGWAVVTVWECQLRDMAAVTERMVAFLGKPGVANRPCRR